MGSTAFDYEFFRNSKPTVIIKSSLEHHIDFGANVAVRLPCEEPK